MGPNDRIHERSPLIPREEREEDRDGRELVHFSKVDPENPRNWSKKKKMGNIAVIASMTVFSPLASSMFAPGIEEIARSLHVSNNSVIGCQTGYVVMLGIGPLLLAPLSETFGRKTLYLSCFTMFTLLQIPTALSQDLPTLITLRTITGFFGSVGVANGGGTISDMYESSERAGVFGWYLLGPLLGPTIGPLFGGIILDKLPWPWLFWILTIASGVVVIISFIFLHETYVPVLLARRKTELEKLDGGKYYYEGEDDRPLRIKLRESFKRPLKILFTQPIVLTMAAYQALIFATTYSLYTEFQAIYGTSSVYNFSTLQVGLLYLFPGLGFLVAVIFLVPRIDTVYNHLTREHNNIPKPEYRLPLANIGSILIPISLFWFAWTVQFHLHWAVTITSTFFYGIGQIAIFNSVQNYYIDSFEKFAASAIAAGALFRSVIGGIVPIFTPILLEKFGVGWGMSIFGFMALVLAPSPMVFWYYGESMRKRFAIEL